MPVLVLTGDTDRLVPPEHARQFNEAIQGSQIVVFEATGHIPHEERPDQSAMAVREFLYQQIEGSALAPLPEVDCAVDARC
jgi:pimeloyl-ACP methyl ester carboxylesterase